MSGTKADTKCPDCGRKVHEDNMVRTGNGRTCVFC